MLETSVADKVPALITARSFADASAVATNARLGLCLSTIRKCMLKRTKTHLSFFFLLFRDAEFIFYTLMECEKACMASAKDTSVGQSAFLSTVVLKFTAESVNTLRRYYEAMPDVKHVMNLLLRGNRFVDAGAVMARRGMSTADIREGQSMLKVCAASNEFAMLFFVCVAKINRASPSLESIGIFPRSRNGEGYSVSQTMYRRLY
jgi:hypothetical protein